MFEDYTYELLLADVLANAPGGVDTRQGSIFYDAVSGILIKIAKLYTDLELVFELTQIDTTTGEYLDKKASEYGITRHSATSTQYNFSYTGTEPDTGERFFTNGAYFVLKEASDGSLYLQAETSGTSGNSVQAGTPAIPVNNIQGLTSATFGEIREYGTDAETDDALRMRLREKIASPTENGNKQHYKTWCESFDGVGRARITALWNGPNTVKAVLINPLGLPCSEALVNEVQEYIDPATKGYTTEVNGKTYVVGDGLGNGVANLGAHFTAVAADKTVINVEFTAELISGATDDDAVEEMTEALTSYLRELVLTTESEDTVVRLSAVGAIIAGLHSIQDYSDLKINGDTENVTPGEENVPVTGEVTVNVL